MIKFAIKNSETGQWRSASWSDSFSDWSDAQLWNNAKTAKTEIKRQEKRQEWDYSPVGALQDYSKAVKKPMNLKCELVAVNIPEPN